MRKSGPKSARSSNPSSQTNASKSCPISDCTCANSHRDPRRLPQPTVLPLFLRIRPCAGAAIAASSLCGDRMTIISSCCSLEEVRCARGTAVTRNQDFSNLQEADFCCIAFLFVLCVALIIPELIIYGFSVHGRQKARPGQEQVRSVPVDLTAPPHTTCIAASCNSLQLSTSRHTNIVSRALAKRSGATGIAPPAAAHVPLRSDFMRKPIYMRPGELWSMPRLAEFDLVCVVLHVFEEDERPQLVGAAGGSGGGGTFAAVRMLRRRRLLVAGLSGDMLLLDVNESKEHMYFPSGLVSPAVLLIENLQYNRFEKKLFLHTAQATALTIFKTKGALRLASMEHGSAAPSTPTPSPALTHALYAHPCLALFQSWASSTPAAMLFDTILQLVRRMIQGAWCGDQASSFNKDEFAAVRHQTMRMCDWNGRRRDCLGTGRFSLSPSLPVFVS